MTRTTPRCLQMQVVTYPLLLVKSRLMATSASTEAELRYSGTLDALLRIWKSDGA